MVECSQTTGSVLTLLNLYYLCSPYIKWKETRKSVWILRRTYHKQFSMYADAFLLVSFFFVNGIRKLQLCKSGIIFYTQCTKKWYPVSIFVRYVRKLTTGIIFRHIKAGKFIMDRHQKHKSAYILQSTRDATHLFCLPSEKGTTLKGEHFIFF